MICTSTGIGVLPCFIGDSSKELVRILPDDVELTRNFWMVIHRDVRHLAWVDAFVRWLDAIVNDERALLLGHAIVEQARKIGRASVRERVCRYGEVGGVAEPLKT